MKDKEWVQIEDSGKYTIGHNTAPLRNPPQTMHPIFPMRILFSNPHPRRGLPLRLDDFIVSGDSYVVDKGLSESVHAHKWRKCYGRSRKYWGANIKGKTTLLHRFIYEAAHGPIPTGHEIDHIDKNPDNNALENLRAVTRSTNQYNRGLQRNNTSGHRSVRWYKAYSKWSVNIKHLGRSVFFGYFSNKDDAITAARNGYTKLLGTVPQ